MLKPSLLLALLLYAGPAAAEQAAAALPQAFDAATPAALAQRFAGRPYILAFWSLGCTWCLDEMENYAHLLKDRPDLPLALVSIDAPVLAPQVAARLQQLGIAPGSQWSFADAPPQRLRAAVDWQWRGEVPRTYLFDAGHHAEVVVGALDPGRLDDWLAAHLPPRP